MPTIAVYDWSVVTHNGTLTAQQLATDTHANDPAAPNYDPGRSSWVNITYTYTGAPAVPIKISDDDSSFDDNVTETGAPQVLLEAVTLNGVTYPAGSVVENEFSLIQSGFIEVFVLRIAGDNVGFVPAEGLPAPWAGAQYTPTQSRDGILANSGTGTTNATGYETVVCFGAKSAIATPDGPRAAGLLQAGDLVDTADHGPQPLLWVGRSEVAFAQGADRRRPVRIRAGALGPGAPSADLLLSPQHRILLRDGQGREALGPALGFLGLRGVSRAAGRGRIVYVSLLFAAHELIRAEGLLCESFFPGRVALRMLAPEARAEVLARRPDAAEGAPRDSAARALLSRSRTAALLRAHPPARRHISPLKPREKTPGTAPETEPSETAPPPGWTPQAAALL